MDTKKIFQFDIFGAPRLCFTCERLSFLRCFCCDTIYCSGECQVKDWVSHHASLKSSVDAEVDNISITVCPKTSSLDVKVEKLTPEIEKVEQEITEIKKTVTNERSIPDKLTKQSVAKSKPLDLNDPYPRGAPFLNGVPNSLTYKLMEPKFPENVKNGVKISVQERLAKALGKSGKETPHSKSLTEDVVMRDDCESLLLKKTTGAIPKRQNKTDNFKLNDDKENGKYCLSLKDLM